MFATHPTNMSSTESDMEVNFSTDKMITDELSNSFPTAPAWAIGLHLDLAKKVEKVSSNLERVESKCDVALQSITEIRKTATNNNEYIELLET